MDNVSKWVSLSCLFLSACCFIFSVLDESRMCFQDASSNQIIYYAEMNGFSSDEPLLFIFIALICFLFSIFFVLSKICSSSLDHLFYFIDVFNCAVEYVLYSAILSAITWQYRSMWQLLVIGRNFSFLSFYSVRLHLLVSGTQKIDSSFTIFTYSVKYSVLF